MLAAAPDVESLHYSRKHEAAAEAMHLLLQPLEYVTSLQTLRLGMSMNALYMPAELLAVAARCLTQPADGSGDGRVRCPQPRAHSC